MNKLEVFFDYACPYCLKGHKYLIEIMQNCTDIEIIWCPCEAHPRPDRYGPHSDLCIQGMFYAAENNINILEYHKRIYKLIHEDRVDIENLDILAENLWDLVNTAHFITEIKNGKYLEKLKQANAYACEKSGVWAVPAYRLNEKKLNSVENIGVTKEQLADFVLKS